jgi:hypothetical protein
MSVMWKAVHGQPQIPSEITLRTTNCERRKVFSLALDKATMTHDTTIASYLPDSMIKGMTNEVDKPVKSMNTMTPIEVRCM